MTEGGRSPARVSRASMDCTAPRLASMASRLTVATVGRTILLPRPLQILEPRELLEEGEFHRSRRTVALLADDELGGPFDVRPVVVFVRRVHLLAEDEDHDV